MCIRDRSWSVLSKPDFSVACCIRLSAGDAFLFVGLVGFPHSDGSDRAHFHTDVYKRQADV